MESVKDIFVHGTADKINLTIYSYALRALFSQHKTMSITLPELKQTKKSITQDSNK